MSKKLQVEINGVGDKKVYNLWELGCLKLLAKYKHMCIGLSSICDDPYKDKRWRSDSMHVVFLDYDDIGFSKMRNEIIHFLMPQYNLSDFFILYTGNPKHWLAISLGKVSLATLRKIFEKASIDEWYKKINLLYNGQAIIRVSHRGKTPAPKCVAFLNSGFNDARQHSLAHWLFFRNVMGIPLPMYENFDNYRRVKVCLYGTNKG